MYCSNRTCPHVLHGQKLPNLGASCPRCGNEMVYSAEELLGDSDVQIVPETRKSQVEMAKLVEKAILTNTHLTVESGVGTGKTFAYLTPAIQNATKIVVSTATKNLQDQIINEDLPYLRQEFKNLRQPHVEAQVFKGKSNYLCPAEFKNANTDLTDAEEKEVWEYIDESEAEQPQDTGEFGDLPHNVRKAADDNVNATGCTGENCELSQRCPYFALQQQDPRVSIVNHAYLMSMYQYKRDWFKDVDVVIIDEAHRFDSFTCDAFASSIDFYRIQKDIEKLIDESKHLFNKDNLRNKVREDLHDLDESVHTYEKQLKCADHGRLEICYDKSQGAVTNFRMAGEAKDAAETIYNWLTKSNEHQTRLVHTNITAIYRKYKKEFKDLISFFKSIQSTKKPFKNGREAVRLHSWARDTTGSIIKFLKKSTLNAKYVDTQNMHKYHKLDNKKTVEIKPVVSAPYVERFLQDHDFTAIFTSATMSDRGNLNDFERDLGLSDASSDDYQSYTLGTNYDYAKQIQAYIPDESTSIMPVRSHSDSYQFYIDDLTERIHKLADITDGYMFVLFTSYKDLNSVYKRIDLPYTPFRQTRLESTDETLERYLDAADNNEKPILLGTKSFWHGVSVEGPDLQQVIIPKAPFPNPGDPQLEGKASVFNTSTFALSKPEMVKGFMQGAGRLIRTNTDQGILSILDGRIRAKSWGKAVIHGLPQIVPDENIVTDINELEPPY